MREVTYEIGLGPFEQALSQHYKMSEMLGVDSTPGLPSRIYGLSDLGMAGS